MSRRRVDTAPLPFTSLRELDQDVLAGVWRALLPGGRELLLVKTHGVWVFLRVVDLASRTIRARVLLRTPQPVDAALVELGSDRLLVVGKRAAVLCLLAPAWTVQLWGERIGIASPEETFDHIAMVPNTVFLWVALRPGGDRRWIVRVIDLRSGRMVRDRPSSPRCEAS